MADPRDNPVFWETRARLEQTLGPKIPLKDLIPLIREIGSKVNVRIPREVVRKKNSAIGWICQNIKESEPFLPAVPVPVIEKGIEARVRRNWPTILHVKAWLKTKFGAHPKMPQITALAMEVAGAFELRIDRQARRSKAALECWFAEHWEETAGARVEDIDFHFPLNSLIEPPAVDQDLDFSGYDRTFDDL
jgi:hypothetical protein